MKWSPGRSTQAQEETAGFWSRRRKQQKASGAAECIQTTSRSREQAGAEDEQDLKVKSTRIPKRFLNFSTRLKDLLFFLALAVKSCRFCPPHPIKFQNFCDSNCDMNLKRAVTPFALGLFKHKGTWRRTSGSWCQFEPYGFPETSKKEEDKPTKIYRRFGPRSDSFIKFSTANVCPSVVIVSPENGNRGSGIIIDSKGTILIRASNIFSPDFGSKINVSLHDRRKFSGIILEVNEDHDLALLKIESEIPLPTTMFGTLENYKARELISIHCLLRAKAYPRTSSQNEVDEEDNLMLSYEEFRSIGEFEDFSLMIS